MEPCVDIKPHTGDAAGLCSLGAHRALRELKQKEVSDRLVELVSTLPPLAQRHKQLLEMKKPEKQ